MELLHDIRAVTFDVGGTLMDPWPSVGHVYAEIAARHGFTGLEPENLTRQFVRAWRSKTSFDYTRAAWAEVVSKTFEQHAEPGRQMPFFDELYERFAEPGVWRVYEDVLPAIEMLIERGVELGLVSNWDERLRPLLRKLKLGRYFRVIIISQEIGFYKPSSVIFHEAARKFTCPASGVLHIGDSEMEDVQGARRAGLQALLLDRRSANPAPGSISSLRELEACLA
ncbi:MAG: HAD family hydrolase [Pedosphaera sp.]|nr:HAD family hydrolase [Pedosphaera sp.]